MRNVIGLLITTTLLSCGLSNGNVDSSSTLKNNGDFVQTAEITVDGKKTIFDKEDLLSMAFTNDKFLSLSIFSENKDIQFGMIAEIGELKIGTYQVFTCRGPSQCEGQNDKKNQSASFGPYPPKDGITQLNLYRMAYLAPDLGLKPLNFTISSITDAQQAGNPRVTKRVKGQFDGVLGYAEIEAGGYKYKLVGKTKEVKGQFDVYCSTY